MNIHCPVQDAYLSGRASHPGVGRLNEQRRFIDITESMPHPKLWFDDGSLVIQATSVRFRIHRTIICGQSTIFRDMISLPQPHERLDAENTFEGCPLVQLADDPDDLSTLLEAVYDPGYFGSLLSDIEAGKEDIVLRSLSGILRVSTKYEFEALRKKSIRLLQLLCPIELDDFITHITDSHTGSAENEVLGQMERFFAIIELCASCGLPQFLPAALYRVSCLLAPNGSQDHLLINSPKIDDNYKSWCLSGRTRMQQIAITVIPSGCSVTQNGVSVPFCNPPPGRRSGKKLFKRSKWPAVAGSCYQCVLQAEEDYYAEQQAAWELLPSYFGFPGKSWSDLKQSDEEVNN